MLEGAIFRTISRLRYSTFSLFLVEPTGPKHRELTLNYLLSSDLSLKYYK